MELLLYIDAIQLLILILFPIVGFAMQANTSKENIIKILKANLILLIPIVFGYDYALKWLAEFCLMLVLATGFSFFLLGIKKQMNQYLLSLILSFVLIVLLGGLAFFDFIAGNKTRINKWRENSYRVEYMRDQGFAGPPLMTYELYYTPLFGLLNKKIQTIPINQKRVEESCILNFDKTEIDFNKCTNTFIFK